MDDFEEVYDVELMNPVPWVSSDQKVWTLQEANNFIKRYNFLLSECKRLKSRIGKWE